MDAVIFALIPTILFAVAGVVLIERMRIKEGEQGYQHEEYKPEAKAGNGNGASGNGHGPPGRRRRRRDRPPPPGAPGDN